MSRTDHRYESAVGKYKRKNAVLQESVSKALDLTKKTKCDIELTPKMDLDVSPLLAKHSDNDEKSDTSNSRKINCYGMSASLLELQTYSEENWLNLQIQLRGNNHGVWLGYSDIQKEGQFVTLSAAKVLQYTNWSKGEPNNVNGIEHCTGYFRVLTPPKHPILLLFFWRSVLLCFEFVFGLMDFGDGGRLTECCVKN
uniref:Uncharacterized protein n=1 Tax=Magallana gigas TaxID=29159 RepID=K1QSB5_MAGGI